MQGSWNNQQAYYRCRLAGRQASSNDLDHPKVVYLQEAKILDAVDGWLTTSFGPNAVEHTIAAITQQAIDPEEATLLDLRKQLSQCDRKLNQYRSALDTRGDLIEIFSWDNRAKHDGADLERGQKAVPVVQSVNDAEIRSVIEEIGDVVSLVGEADPGDKAEIYLQLGLKLTYRPDKRTVEARVESGRSRGRPVCFRAKLRTC